MPRKNYLEGGLEIQPVSTPPSGLSVGESYFDDGTNTSSGLPGWRYLASTGPDVFGDASSVTGSIDATAIHKTTADEFDTAAIKASPVSADRVLLEDSESGLAKKYATLGTLPDNGSVPNSQVYFVGKHGNDSNTGKTPELAFLTIGKATTEITGQTPSASNRFSIMIVDSGIYSENVQTPNFTDLNAPTATIQSVGAGTAFSVGHTSTTRIYEIIQDTGTSAIVRRDSVGSAYVDVDRIVLGDTGFSIGVSHLGTTITSVLLLKAGTIRVGDGKGIAVNAAGHTHFDVEDIYLSGNNSIGIERTVAGTSLGRVTHILEEGSPSSTTAINVTNGRISAQIDTINTDTAWNVGASGQLDLYYSESNGVTVETGTVNLTQVGVGGGSGGVGGEDSNLWAHPASAHANDDEFDSGTLNAAWNVYNMTGAAAGSVSLDPVDAYDQSFNTGDDLRIELHGSTRRSWLLAQPPSTKRLLLYKSFTFPTNVLIIARLKFSISNATSPNNDRNIGLGVFSDNGGVPDYSSDYAYNLLNESTSTTQANYLLFDGITKEVDIQTTDTQQQGQALEYVAIHKIGTTYHGYVGTASGNWIWLGSDIISTALAYVGFTFENQSLTSPGASVFGVDFIRFIETDNFLF